MMFHKRWLPVTALTVVVAAAGGCRDDDDYVTPTVQDNVVIPTTPTRDRNDQYGDTISNDELSGETTDDGWYDDTDEELYGTDDLYGERTERERMPMTEGPFDQTDERQRTMPNSPANRDGSEIDQGGQEIPGPSVEYQDEDD